MANKFRGTTWNNASFGPKIQIRRSIDLAELGDFGSITENSSDLPTRGATHRKATGGSTSATRGYTDLQGLFDVVVDNQDMGEVADATTAHRIWSSTGAITDIVTSAPTGILPGSGSSSSGASWTKTWDLTDWGTTERIEETSSLTSALNSSNQIDGYTPYLGTNGSKVTWSGDGYYIYATTSSYWLQRETDTPYDASSSAKVEDKSIDLNATGSPDSPFSNHLMRRQMRPINDGNMTVSWYGVNTTTGGRVQIDDLEDQWDVTSVEYGTSNNYDIGDDVSTSYYFPKDIQFNSDGTAMYALFTLGMQWNASTSKFESVNGNSKKSSILKWTLSTAWDVSTASITSDDVYNFSSPSRKSAVAFGINPDETEFYSIVEESSTLVRIELHEIPTAGDLSSMSTYDYGGTDNVYRSILTATGASGDIKEAMFSADGKIITLFGSTGNLYIVDLEAGPE
jgi:hypothetical protein